MKLLISFRYSLLKFTETLTQAFSIKQLFRIILQSSQENTCDDVYPPTLLKNDIVARYLSVIFVERKKPSPKVSEKKVFLKISESSQENTLVRFFFLIMLQASTLQLYLKSSGIVNFAKSLSAPILQSICKRLFLALDIFGSNPF